MSYAARLQLTCTAPIDFFADTEHLGSHGRVRADGLSVVSRKRLTKQETANILRMLPAGLRKHCLGVSKNNIYSLGPHVHTEEHCTINFYYKTNGETTIFYDGNYVPDDATALDRGHNYYMVKPEFLSPVLSYTANDGDVWLLNTRKAHAVVGNDSLPRHVLQVYMKMPYEKVLDCFLAGAK